MPQYEQILVDPSATLVSATLEDAVKQANYRCRVGKLTPNPDAYKACGERVADEPEGVMRWIENHESIATLSPGDLLTLLGIAWWSDHLGHRHVRVVGKRLERHREHARNRFGPLNEEVPPVCLVYPERLVIRRKSEAEPEVIAVCHCGAMGKIEDMAWMALECGPCFDQRQEKPEQVNTTELGMTVTEYGGAVMGAGFSTNGKLIASAGYSDSSVWNGNLRLHEWPSREVIKDQELNAYAGAERFGFACNGQHAAAGEYEGIAWLEMKKRTKLVRGDGVEYVEGLALAPDGSWVAVSDYSHVMITPLGTKQRWKSLQSSEGSSSCRMAASADSRLLAIGSGEGHVSVYDVAKKKTQELHNAISDNHVRSLAFHPTEPKLFTGAGVQFLEYEMPEPDVTGEYPLLVWDLDAGVVESQLAVLDKPIEAIAVSPDGTTLVVGGADRLLHFWNPGTNERMGALDWHLGAVTSLAFSPRGDLLVSGSADGRVRVWPWRTIWDV